MAHCSRGAIHMCCLLYPLRVLLPQSPTGLDPSPTLGAQIFTTGEDQRREKAAMTIQAYYRGLCVRRRQQMPLRRQLKYVHCTAIGSFFAAWYAVPRCAPLPPKVLARSVSHSGIPLAFP